MEDSSHKKQKQNDPESEPEVIEDDQDNALFQENVTFKELGVNFKKYSNIRFAVKYVRHVKG